MDGPGEKYGSPEELKKAIEERAGPFQMKDTASSDGDDEKLSLIHI